MRYWDLLKFLLTGRATMIDPYVGYTNVRIMSWAWRWHLIRENLPRPFRLRAAEPELPPYEGADDTEGWEIPEEWLSLDFWKGEEDEDGRSAS